MMMNKLYRIFLWIILPPFAFSILSCTPKNISYKPDETIAVWNLDDVSPLGNTGPDLGELFANQVIETLKEKEGITIVERDRLLLALEELNLGTSSLADEDTRLELGRLVGARLMVFGSYQVVGDMMRVDLRLVEVEHGKIIKAVKKNTSTTDLSGWLEAVRKAAAMLL